MPSGNLQIANATQEDEGPYKCAAYNPVTQEIKTSSSTDRLRIRRESSSPTLSTSKHKVLCLLALMLMKTQFKDVPKEVKSHCEILTGHSVSNYMREDIIGELVTVAVDTCGAHVSEFTVTSIIHSDLARTHLVTGDDVHNSCFCIFKGRDDIHIVI